MPRHLISDAHEWINEIPTVPIYYLAKPQPRERAWQNQRGKKTLLDTLDRAVGGSVPGAQHPPSLFYSGGFPRQASGSVDVPRNRYRGDPSGRLNARKGVAGPHPGAGSGTCYPTRFQFVGPRVRGPAHWSSGELDSSLTL